MANGYDLFPSVGTYLLGKERDLTPTFLSLSWTQSRREEESHTRSYVERDLLVPSAFWVRWSGHSQGAPLSEDPVLRKTARSWSDEPGTVRLSPQHCVHSRDAGVERKTFTVENSVYKAPSGEPGESETDVKEWCLPGQKVQRPFPALHHLHSFLSRQQRRQTGTRQADLQGSRVLHGKNHLLGTVQVHAIPGYPCGMVLPRCMCVGGSVEGNFVTALCFISSSQATDIARTAPTTWLQVENTGSRWVKAHLLYRVFSWSWSGISTSWVRHRYGPGNESNLWKLGLMASVLASSADDRFFSSWVLFQHSTISPTLSQAKEEAHAQSHLAGIGSHWGVEGKWM